MLRAGAPTEAEQAFLHADYEKAVRLYGDILDKNPNDPATVASSAGRGPSLNTDQTQIHRLAATWPSHSSADAAQWQLPPALSTGAFATTISPEAARDITKVHSDYSTEIRGISGKVNKVYTANKVVAQFANMRQELDDVYAFDTSRISKNAGMEISGFLGFSTLHMLNIHIDYRDGLVKFEYERGRGYQF